LHDDTREVHIQCAPNSRIDDYVTFQKLLEKHKNHRIKDVEYLRRQDWVEWVIEHRAKKQVYTKYTFHGLQGTKEACYKERQEEQERRVLSKAYKD